MRIARDLGQTDSLLPPGVTSLLDIPYPLYHAIRVALMVNGWDDLEEHERPPKHLWMGGPGLREWFANVRANRRRDMEQGGPRHIEDPVDNEAAKGLIVG